MGEAIEQLGHRKILINVGGGFDFVDVRDVVAGMIGAIGGGARAKTSCCQERGCP
jgi:hypothetical protein